MHSVAIPRAPDEIPSAPLRPSLEMERKTLTTRTFKGIPKRFMMTDRCESGIYLLRSVPMVGKYMPTQASNAKKETMSPARFMVDETVKVAVVIAAVARVSIKTANFSVGTDILASCPNNVDPSKQLAMKQEKTVPYGVAAPAPNALATALLIAGGHCKTKMYMAASKRLCTPPTSIIFGSSLITWIASLIEGLLDTASLLSSLVLLFCATFSFHKKAASAPPRARKPVDNSNGPVGPRLEAAAPAN